MKSYLKYLPPAYVVRREGNSFTLFVCPHLGGYPYPIMLCNISQNAMRQWGGSGNPPGGVPGQVPPPGGVRVPPRGGTRSGTPQGGPGTPPGGYPVRYPGGFWVHPPGGYPVRYPPGGGTQSGTPPGGVPGQDNRRSTHYTAGGMPLAFTQEDFLVVR